MPVVCILLSFVDILIFCKTPTSSGRTVHGHGGLECISEPVRSYTGHAWRSHDRRPCMWTRGFKCNRIPFSCKIKGQHTGYQTIDGEWHIDLSCRRRIIFLLGACILRELQARVVSLSYNNAPCLSVCLPCGFNAKLDTSCDFPYGSGPARCMLILLQL